MALDGIIVAKLEVPVPGLPMPDNTLHYGSWAWPANKSHVI